MTATQSGANVRMSPMVLSGQCARVLPSIPLGDEAITTTGSLGSVVQSNVPVASCGGTYNADGSGGFFGSTFQYTHVFTAASGDCVSQVGNYSIAATLIKQ
jgi:hypothetical protein